MSRPPCMTPPEAAKFLRIGRDKLLGMIRDGTLPAVNVAAKTSTRPRYIVTPEAMESFITRRSVLVESPRPRRRRRTQAPGREWF
ncbi:MAG: helix-turn-helix domain-containing protein [Sedimentisphaerales bacterium]|nr:helix-turn-helix domain-containing protein [Sedimentisphaerales bacterium]